MTLQHIAGELSQILCELQDLSTDERSARDLRRLRREAETCPVGSLRSVILRALMLTDGLCWASLAEADAIGFTRQAAAGAALHEFGLCAGLLDEDEPRV